MRTTRVSFWRKNIFRRNRHNQGLKMATIMVRGENYGPTLRVFPKSDLFKKVILGKKTLELENRSSTGKWNNPFFFCLFDFITLLSRYRARDRNENSGLNDCFLSLPFLSKHAIMHLAIRPHNLFLFIFFSKSFIRAKSHYLSGKSLLCQINCSLRYSVTERTNYPLFYVIIFLSTFLYLALVIRHGEIYLVYEGNLELVDSNFCRIEGEPISLDYTKLTSCQTKDWSSWTISFDSGLDALLGNLSQNNFFVKTFLKSDITTNQVDFTNESNDSIVSIEIKTFRFFAQFLSFVLKLLKAFFGIIKCIELKSFTSALTCFYEESGKEKILTIK